jgi:hypothetical protein
MTFNSQDWQHSSRKSVEERLQAAREIVEHEVNVGRRAQYWSESRPEDLEEHENEQREQDRKFGKQRTPLPICPYGCGREGTLLEVVIREGGQAIGIFNDHPCSCIFIADIQLPEPPRQRKQKLVLGADGEYHMEEVDA